MNTALTNRHQREIQQKKNKRFRKGIVAALTVAVLPVTFAFVAYSVDTGRINCAHVDLQNAVDAAALAASRGS